MYSGKATAAQMSTLGDAAPADTIRAFSLKYTHTHTDTVLTLTGHFISVVRDGFTSLSLTAPCTATPPWICNKSN